MKFFLILDGWFWTLFSSGAFKRLHFLIRFFKPVPDLAMAFFPPTNATDLIEAIVFSLWYLIGPSRNPLT